MLIPWVISMCVVLIAEWECPVFEEEVSSAVLPEPKSAAGRLLSQMSRYRLQSKTLRYCLDMIDFSICLLRQLLFQLLHQTVCLNVGRTGTASISTTPPMAVSRARAPTVQSTVSANPAPLQPVHTPSYRTAVGPARVQFVLRLRPEIT